MAGLEALDEEEPRGSRDQSEGDNAIRETRQKTKASVAVEHSLRGYHTFPKGTIVTQPVPSADEVGHIYLREENGGNIREILVWNGSSYDAFTKNQQVLANTALISNHQTSDPLDHADESITRDKLKAGLLAKKHFINGSNDNSTVDELVDGSVTNLHSHPTQEISYGGGGPVFLSTRINVASGTADVNWTTCGNAVSNALPSGVRAVILEAFGKTQPNIENVQSGALNPVINIGQGANSYEQILIGGWIKYSNIYSGIDGIGWRGQGTFYVNSSKKFSYNVQDFNKEWNIWLVGYVI